MTEAGTRLIQAAQEADAFMSGGYAWEDGATLTSNPHAIGSGAHEMWREGWFAAEEDFRQEGDCVLGKPST